MFSNNDSDLGLLADSIICVGYDFVSVELEVKLASALLSGINTVSVSLFSFFAVGELLFNSRVSIFELEDDAGVLLSLFTEVLLLIFLALLFGSDSE